MKDVADLVRFLDPSPEQGARIEGESREEPEPISPLPDRGQRFREELPEAPGPMGPPALGTGPEWGAAHFLLEKLRAEIAGLRDRTAQADLPEQEPGAGRAEIETLPGQPQEVRSGTPLPDAPEAHAEDAEIKALRARLEEQAAVDSERLNRLTEECDAARADRDRSEAGRERLARELKQTQDQLGAEREVLVREVEQLQNALERWEGLRDNAVLEHEEDRARWEGERQELEARGESQRTEILDAQRRLAEQHEQFEAERVAWNQEFDERTRQIAELDRQISDLTQHQVRTGLERDALAREVAQWREKLDALERSRAGAEAEFQADQARWETERQELQAHWEQESRDLHAGAERRLAEQQARFEVERRAWDQQLDEHAQLAGEWESLAREVDQVQASLIDEREALLREVTQLREKLDDLERSRDKAEEEFDAAQARWLTERQELQTQGEQEVEKLTQARRQVERELRQEHDRLVAERDALARESEQAREQLDFLRQSQAEYEREQIESRTRWEVERRELDARWERQSQDLGEEMGRRLAEQQQQQFEAERERQNPGAIAGDGGPRA